ncbi:ATP-dependent DNA helicase [Nephila pilipes]|uniref:ATP-dependent DNA helicase n=1 Tax=Nephila pilipes TaxID=299642 RepID=A0A8X6J7P4_NEPPI|nr:ATP-dependent DNA helicase [Nephila pilipes]
MIVFCQVGDPLKLWGKYRESLSEDIRRRMGRENRNSEPVVDIVYNQCLILLEDIVTSMSGKSLLHFGLPEPIREQSIIINNQQEGKIIIPNNLCDTVGDLITLTDRIYPNIEYATFNSLSWLKERAILTPTNESADKINDFMLEKLTTEQIKYESIDTVTDIEDTVHYPVEFLHTLNPQAYRLIFFI